MTPSDLPMKLLPVHSLNRIALCIMFCQGKTLIIIGLKGVITGCDPNATPNDQIASNPCFCLKHITNILATIYDIGKACTLEKITVV